MTIGSGEGFALGRVFDPDGNSDLRLEFLRDGAAQEQSGVVRYRLGGDFNGDGAVNAADYVVWRNFFGEEGGPADASGPDALGVPDGVVDEHDLAYWKLHYGSVAPGDAPAVPEPAGWLIVVAAVGFTGHKQRVRQAVRVGGY